jgi:VWFA-related protein
MDCDFKRRKQQMQWFFSGIFVAFTVVSAAVQAFGQPECVSDARVKTLSEQIKNVSALQADSQLKDEILALKNDLVKQAARSVAGHNDPTNKSESPIARLCQILQTKTWPGKTTVDAVAASAWVRLLKTYLSVQDQRRLLPVISAGVDSGEILKDDELAAFIDRLRLRLGVPQLFGTQVTEQAGFLLLYPLQSDQHVNGWRKEYGMPPLNDYLRAMQNVYRKLVIRSTAKVRRSTNTEGRSTTSAVPPLSIESDEEVIKVDTSLVIIDATVSGKSVPNLQKSDFKVLEDGQPQEIANFSASDSPFDIVLLLDLSGSTADKLDLIKKTTKNFIEMKRDADRVAIITFNSSQTIVSQLQSDKAKLLNSVSEIKGIGASLVWDAEKFALDLLQRDSSEGRRKAVVVMTDGIDNALFFTGGTGSKILFGDLLELVRNSQVAIFPIFLNPTGPDSLIGNTIENARRTMQLLADESGGTFYTTANLEKLSEVYERVMQDVGRVYSLGYQPSNQKRDGTWRAVRVELPNYSQLRVRARSGYYAK